LPASPQVAASKRCRAIALVLLGIFLIADPNMLGVEKADDGRENRFFREFASLEILLDPPAKPLQGLPEFKQSLVFRAVSLGPEIGVISILCASSRIDAGRLQMTVRVGAKPCIGIGRGQSDRIEPLDFVAVRDAIA
jgi:hypothetical protein